MTKYAIPAAKTYFLPIAQQHLMFFTSSKGQKSGEPSKNVDNPIVHGLDSVSISGEVRSSNSGLAVFVDGKPSTTPDNQHVDLEKSATNDSSSGNSKKEDNSKLVKHLYTDLQLITAYAIIIYVLATTTEGTSRFSKFYAYQTIMGKFYFSMVLTACVALMLDPAVDASLNYSEPITKGKILNRYRSGDGIISLYVYLTICCCNTGPMNFIQTLNDPAVPSEYEKAEFSTLEQLLCGCSKKRDGETPETTTPTGATGTDHDNIEYKWLEIIYCVDQIMRWFY
eukprot:gene33189-42920_t